jgi:hypothetical protein
MDPSLAASIADKLQSLTARCAQLEQDLTVTNRLLEERNAFLDRLPPCPFHGPRCLPYLTEWISRLLVPGHVDTDHGTPVAGWHEVDPVPGEPLIGHHGDLDRLDYGGAATPNMPYANGFYVDLRPSARYPRRLELWIGVPLTAGYSLRLAGQLTELLRDFYPDPTPKEE